MGTETREVQRGNTQYPPVRGACSKTKTCDICLGALEENGDKAKKKRKAPMSYHAGNRKVDLQELRPTLMIGEVLDNGFRTAGRLQGLSV